MKILSITIGAFLLYFSTFVSVKTTESSLFKLENCIPFDSCITQKSSSLTDLQMKNVNDEVIWGNFSYLDTLKKYNSISKADSAFGHQVVQFRVSGNDMYISTPYSLESHPLKVGSFDIQTVDDNTLLIVDNTTNSKQLMKKIIYDKNVCNNIDLFDFAIRRMRYMWFKGVYDIFDENKEIGRMCFDENGNVKGYENLNTYGLGKDVEGKDYIYFEQKNDSENYEYLLFDFSDHEQISLYSTLEYEDIDIPLVRTKLKMILKKIE